MRHDFDSALDGLSKPLGVEGVELGVVLLVVVKVEDFSPEVPRGGSDGLHIGRGNHRANVHLVRHLGKGGFEARHPQDLQNGLVKLANAIPGCGIAINLFVIRVKVAGNLLNDLVQELCGQGIRKSSHHSPPRGYRHERCQSQR